MSDEILQQLLKETMSQGATLAELKTGMETLLGNGQPGRIALIESDVEELKAVQNRGMGVVSAFAFLITCWEWIKWHWHLS